MSRIQVLLALAFLAVTGSAWAQYSGMAPPPTWQPYGGFGGYNMVRPNNLSLVISQTQDVHEQITNLMDQLRRLQDQQVAVSTRFQTLNDNFYERMGINFGFNLRPGRGIVGLDPTGRPTPNGEIQFRQGSFGVTPQFGGYDPAADATGGFMVKGKKADLLFNFAFGQGSTRSNVVQQPRVVLYNGVPGSISDTSQRPFVTGVIPVVSNNVPGALQPTANAPAVSPIRQLIAQYKQQQAEAAEKEGFYKEQNEHAPPAQVEAAQPAVAANSERPKEDAPLILGGSKKSSSVHQPQAEDAATESKPSDEIKSLLDRAYAAQDAGKNNVAKIYYQQAAARASGELKRELIEKIKALK